MKILTFVPEMMELSQVACGHITLAAQTNGFTCSGHFKHINIFLPGNSDYILMEPGENTVNIALNTP